MLWIAVALTGGYLVLVVALYLGQRALLYYPDNEPLATARERLPDYELFETTTEDGLALTHLYRPPSTAAAPIVVLFHGNAGHAGDRAHKLDEMLPEGAGVLLAEYRGYGGNPGRPSEAGLLADARSVLAALEGPQSDGRAIFLYGESLGTGVAVALAAEQAAAERPVAGVVLESPFTSVAETAQHHYWYIPARVLVKDRFDSHGRIAGLAAPVLIVHGTFDRTVPYRFGRRLYEAAVQPKRLVTVAEAGHLDLFDRPEISEEVQEFLTAWSSGGRTMENFRPQPG
jgi:fermentation-respiration switch protein FrsA (DUF1100 family)